MGGLISYFANPSFATLLDFEQFDAPKKVATQFSSRGVRFAPQAIRKQKPRAMSGTRAVSYARR